MAPTMDFEAYLATDLPAPELSDSLVELLRNEDAAGIEYAVVMPIPIDRPNNRALFETVRGERRVLPCCQVNPNLGDDAVREFEVAATEWGMRMLKLMPLVYNCPTTSPQTRVLMDKAREFGTIVNIHSGGNLCHPLEIGALCRRYPEVPVIMDHMGYRYDLRDAILAVEDNPNLYLGTTIASFEPSFIKRAIDAVGPERVIFGSNLPLLYSDLAVESIRRGKFGREVEDLVLGGNLARLYGMA
jgi:uncharacterized protein